MLEFGTSQFMRIRLQKMLVNRATYCTFQRFTCFQPRLHVHNVTIRPFSGSKGPSDDDDSPQNKKLTDYYSQYVDTYSNPDQEQPHVDIVSHQKPSPISSERGIDGVFDPPELVEFIRAQRARDICCIRMPDDVSYTKYLVVCSPFSGRHMKALIERVVKMYKVKKWRKDPSCLVQGEDDPKWRVVDMNNIVLHVMTSDTREKYDIEQLWTVGPEYDGLTKEKEEETADLEWDVKQWLAAAKTQ